jgi:hypothetical protein
LYRIADNPYSRIFRVKKYDKHVYSFRDFNPNAHSIIIWEDFDPNEFSRIELEDVLVGNVLTETRYIFPTNSKSIKASMIFISKKNIYSSIAKLKDMSSKENILNRLMVIESKNFFGSFLYKDMLLNRVENEIAEYDYEKKLKFMKFWFDNIIDLHLEFYHESQIRIEYILVVKNRFLNAQIK